MPWEVKKRASEFCVVTSAGNEKGAGETVECHSSKDDALAHVKALYAKEKSPEPGVSAEGVEKGGSKPKYKHTGSYKKKRY